MAVSGFDDESGSFLYGAVASLVLTLGLLVAPALTSTSVNGDRAAGTLAPLQMTLLSPAEIAVGKLLAGWVTSLAFLGTAVPFLLLGMLPGGTGVGRLLVTTSMMALVLLSVCGIALGWSAVCARSVTSAVMTYLTTAFLCSGHPDRVRAVLSAGQPGRERPGAGRPDLQSDHRLGYPDPSGRLRSRSWPPARSPTRRPPCWWLLAANPYVVIADAAPGGGDEDVFSMIKLGVRSAQAGPQQPIDECWSARTYDSDTGLADDQPAGLPAGVAVRTRRQPGPRHAGRGRRRQAALDPGAPAAAGHPDRLIALPRHAGPRRSRTAAAIRAVSAARTPGRPATCPSSESSGRSSAPGTSAASTRASARVK